MFDLDEIYRRVQRANEQAAQTMQELEEKAEQAAPKEPEPAREEKTREDDGRRLEILGQEITPEQLAQMAEDQARLRESIQLQVAAAAAEGVQSLLQATGSEEMGLLVSALETLMLEEDEGEEDEETFEPETEEQLCALLEETMARIEALPERCASIRKQRFCRRILAYKARRAAPQATKAWGAALCTFSIQNSGAELHTP